jgi:hypothetical protein
MPQIRNPLEEIRIAFDKMTYAPDVPSTALAPNEYNRGQNVETDVRGIRNCAGDEIILDQISNAILFISSGFRANGEFVFIVAYRNEGINPGGWAYNNTGGLGNWKSLTVPGADFSNYSFDTVFTDSWNGTIPFFNDGINPPMFWGEEGDNAVPGMGQTMTMYSNVLPAVISTIAYNSPTQQKITIANTFTSTGSSISGTTLTIGTLVTGSIRVGQCISGTGITAGTKIVGSLSGSGSGSTWKISASFTLGSRAITGSPYRAVPYVAGEQIVISGVNDDYDGRYEVVSSTVLEIIYLDSPNAGYPTNPSAPSVAPLYVWNYNPEWASYSAGWMRMYSTPNVGSILVAGNLTAINATTGATELYPVTVQWSQNFGLSEAPLTWELTDATIANQLEVPLRGPSVDAFPCNGQFFVCSYWDTVVFSPLNYTTTSAPILGVRLFNQGRGLLRAGAWGNTDKLVYGVDARDIWVFDGQDFTGLGNQRVKNWFYDQIGDRVFMQVNTQKNQIEVYYNKKLPVTQPLSSTTPIQILDTQGRVRVPINRGYITAAQTVVITGSATNAGTGSIPNGEYYLPSYGGVSQDADYAYFQLYQTSVALPVTTVPGTFYNADAELPTLFMTFTSNPYAQDMLSYRYDLNCWNAPRSIDISGIDTGLDGVISACEGPLWYGVLTDFGDEVSIVWYAYENSRTVIMAGQSYLQQKDTAGSKNGFFARDNIKLIKDYSGKVMVHRVLPEAVNLGTKQFSNNDEIPITPSTGNLTVTITGANSVGQTPVGLNTGSNSTIQLNTDNPWIQVDQNTHRVISLSITGSYGSTQDSWICSATTWQFTQVEDDR